ncbi:Diacetyl reductase [(S)-acetoin forming] [Grifola frondosa]|uniref:Diacetyl reductase [(S)-acetoin forming] n=1 Tax=Grifola frondosa TaxID=5627 RepID=A0A1C7MIT8_GRIFR|nr:Diacetyl reductase [(S)-acetoin forming] [Grifola frondosa]
MTETPLLARLDEVLTNKSGEARGSWMGQAKNRNALGRIGATDDVVGLVSFLASKDSAFITGQSINVDGGNYFN